MARYRELCDQHDWQPSPDQQLYRCFAVIGQNNDHVADLVARINGPAVPPAQASPSDVAQSTDSTLVEEIKAFGFGFPQLTGTPGDLVEQIRDYQAKTGVGILDLSFNMGYFTHEETLAQLQLFGEKVLPQVQKFDAIPA
jgi:alkanesulfonate monooxygenase SsuD/methylene tetrahydromethanopterin reductase-like flavin-dependent oxidoreductase (luciferase family)